MVAWGQQFGAVGSTAALPCWGVLHPLLLARWRYGGSTAALSCYRVASSAAAGLNCSGRYLAWPMSCLLLACAWGECPSARSHVAVLLQVPRGAGYSGARGCDGDQCHHQRLLRPVTGGNGHTWQLSRRQLAAGLQCSTAAHSRMARRIAPFCQPFMRSGLCNAAQ